MDVVQSNFEEALAKFESLLPSCSFVALDEEMSGIRWSKESDPSIGDTVSQRYTKMRRVASNFRIIQLGLALFTDNGAGGLTSHAFNFFLFPGEGNNAPHVVMEADAIHFNRKHNLDFNKWIYQGITYVDEEGEKRITSELFPEPKPDEKAKGPLVLTKEADKDFVQKAIKEFNDWLSGTEEKEYTFPDCNSFLQRAIIQHIEKAQPSLILEKRPKGPWKFALVALRLSDEEKRAREKRIEDEKQAKLRERLGFRRAFKSLVAAKKPLVVHNGLYDLMFMYSHLQGPLPESERQFRESFGKLFPVVFDTKGLVQSAWFVAGDKARARFDFAKGTALSDCVDGIKGSSESKWHVGVKSPEGFDRYETAEAKAFHEAGFDALSTGIVFANVINGNDNSKENQPVASIDFTKHHCVNQLPMNRSLFWFALSASAEHALLEPDAAMIHLGLLTKDINNADLYALFADKKKEGKEKDADKENRGDKQAENGAKVEEKQAIQPVLRWIDDTGLFVVVKPHQLDEAMTLLKNAPQGVFTVSSFDEYLAKRAPVVDKAAAADQAPAKRSRTD